MSDNGLCWATASFREAIDHINGHNDPRVREVAVLMLAMSVDEFTEDERADACVKARLAWVSGSGSVELRDEAIERAKAAVREGDSERKRAARRAVSATAVGDAAWDAAWRCQWDSDWEVFGIAMESLYPNLSNLNADDALVRLGQSAAMARSALKEKLQSRSRQDEC